LKKQTVFVDDTISKNKKSAVVTLPAKVIELMIELEIFRNPSSYYLFSDGFMPGESRRNEKQFRDYWSHYVRKHLRFPKEYKFYSLKDTGIYTPQDIRDANPILLNYKGVL
jgi:hypothetical protein